MAGTTPCHVFDTVSTLLRWGHRLDMPASIQGAVSSAVPDSHLEIALSCTNWLLCLAAPPTPGTAAANGFKEEVFLFTWLVWVTLFVCSICHDRPSTYFTKSCVTLSSDSLICSSFEHLESLQKVCGRIYLLTYPCLSNRGQSPSDTSWHAVTQKTQPHFFPVWLQLMKQSVSIGTLPNLYTYSKSKK